LRARLPAKPALAALLLLHAAFVLAGAAKLRLPSLGPANRLVALYLGLSGAHYSWGFFAPNIGSQFRTEFEVHERGGRVVTEELGSRGPNEVLLRETGIAATFWFGLQDEKIRRSLTASWAAHLFNREPLAESVVVLVSAYYLPSMAQIRSGVKPAWVPVYRATYTRAGAEP
jgi:hypothetical protein